MSEDNNEEIEKKISIEVDVAKQVSFAAHQNSIPLIRQIRVINSTGEVFNDLTLKMTSSPEYIKNQVWNIEKIHSGSEFEVSGRNTHLNGGLLLDQKEASRSDLNFALEDNEGNVLNETTVGIEVLANNEWGGYKYQVDLLSAFSMPNDPIVDQIVSRSIDIQRQHNGTEFRGYSDNSRKNVWSIASSIWSALVEQNIKYSQPPQSFEDTGQKIRGPKSILGAKLGTCIDLTMMFCSCLEQSGLNPLVVLFKGHAFVGLWLKPTSFETTTYDDISGLRNRIELNDILVFETTYLTSNPATSFTSAIEKAKETLLTEEEKFEVVIDIYRSREQKIRPLNLEIDQGVSETEIQMDARQTELEFEKSPELPDYEISENEDEVVDSPETRLDRWQRKLLDLSLRNPLLNTRFNKSVVKFACDDPGLLEDKLADGNRIAIKELPGLDTSNSRDTGIHFDQFGSNLISELTKTGLQSNIVYVKEEQNQLNNRLTKLYRRAKSDLSEGGANTLYLAVGFLKWVKQGRPDPIKAPLILIPVQFKRPSVTSGVKLEQSDDEPSFNTTLLEMLRQDFDFDIPNLEKDLPTDDHGVDVEGIWEYVRKKIVDIPGFEVTKEVVLGRFSFVKYLMWKDLRDRVDDLKNNPVVKHLIESPRDPYTSEMSFIDPRELDKQFKQEKVFTPLPSDSSQLTCVQAASESKDFVIIGPPGSGKSQTIANMITQLMGEGKTVLFVSEKTAALQVVYKRLKEVGLGNFCLELHSNKANKADVINQFKQAWETADELPEDQWKNEAQKLYKLKSELNVYVSKIHAVHENGMTIYKAISDAVSRSELPYIDINLPPSAFNQNQLTLAYEDINTLQLRASELSSLKEHPLKEISVTEWSHSWQSDLQGSVIRLKTSISGLLIALDAFCNRFVLPNDNTSFEFLESCSRLSASLLEGRDKNLAFAFTENASHSLKLAQETIELIKEYQAKNNQLSVEYERRPFNQINLNDLKDYWSSSKNSWWLKSWIEKRKARQMLNSVIGKRANPDLDNDIPVLSELDELAYKIDRSEVNLNSIQGWSSTETNTDSFKEVVEAATLLRRSVFELSTDSKQIQILTSNCLNVLQNSSELLADGTPFSKDLRALPSSFETFQNNYEAYNNLILDDATSVGKLDSISAIQKRLDKFDSHESELRNWCNYQKSRKSIIGAGLKSLIDSLEEELFEPEDSLDVFRKSYAKSWVEQIIDKDDVLKEFSTITHEDKIHRFRELDDNFMKLTSKYVRAKVCSEIPNRDDVKANSEYGQIRRLVGQRRPRKPVRQLIEEIPTALSQLTPVVMMSPLSIAQYLSTSNTKFDAVIFDEASQITVWDAVGSIARAKQTIVAGDPKQLPPTNFFNRSEDDEEEVDEMDMESILDEMIAAGVPKKHLDWHYRSRQESLISFSNHRFYNGELVTFPSVKTDDHALDYIQVKGTYLRGAGRTNKEEAEKVVEELFKILKTRTSTRDNQSVGVVTFNSEQQSLILDLIDSKRSGNSTTEIFFADDSYEPVFVKNLESVQGDERDIIIFSTTYGPDLTGHMTMNFGPLNKEGGERRLNVAITRSRSRMKVVSSISSQDIDLSRTQSRGVSEFKHFLDYAERGVKALGELVYGSAGDFDSEFEKEVAYLLREKGWIVHPQVGVSRFRIDLGIVHPDHPGMYLAGVECDGATYHRSATAKDRDKIREDVLTGLGWNILRIWSTDYWLDKGKQIERVDSELNNILSLSREQNESEVDEEIKNEDQDESVETEEELVNTSDNSEVQNLHGDAILLEDENDTNEDNEVLRHFNLYDSGIYILTVNKLDDANFTAPINEKNKNGFLLQCYPSGHINKFPVSTLLERKLDKEYMNGFNYDADFPEIFILEAECILGLSYYDDNGDEYFKAHKTSDISTHTQLHSHGNKIMYLPYRKLEFRFFPLDIEEKIHRLVRASFNAAGKSKSNDNYSNEWQVIKNYEVLNSDDDPQFIYDYVEPVQGSNENVNVDVETPKETSMESEHRVKVKKDQNVVIKFLNSNTELTVRIVDYSPGPEERLAEVKKINYQSDVAVQIMNKTIGDVVSVGKDNLVEIVEIIDY